MKAGYGFNTYPLMGGDLMPDALFSASPFWSNFVSDKFSVQFIHRWIGTCLAIGLFYFCWLTLKSGYLNVWLSKWTKRTAFFVALQFALGVGTLLCISDYPVFLPLIHQFVALFLFASLLALIQGYGWSEAK
jgi:cytochrome c oxidase assembly protein subunit 15